MKATQTCMLQCSSADKGLVFPKTLSLHVQTLSIDHVIHYLPEERALKNTRTSTEQDTVF